MAGRDLFADERPTTGRDLFAEQRPAITPAEPVIAPTALGAPVAPQRVPTGYQAPSREVVGISPTPERAEEEFGPLDYLMGIVEPAATVVTGAIAEPIAGLVGIGAGLLPGEEGQAARAVETIQEALTYLPRTRGGIAAAQRIGEILQPIAEPIGRAVEAAGEVGYRVAGPVGGAGVVTLLAAIPEILGLKGTRAAKKMAMSRTLKGRDVTELYDELGNLLPEIKKGLDDAGISLAEVEDILPPKVPEEQIRGAAERISEAARARLRPERAALAIAEEVKASPEILRAAEELGISGQLLPSHVSQNPIYVAIEQGLKSIPGSQMAAKEKAIVSSLAKKADDLIIEYGGEIDKSMLSDQFRTASKEIVLDLETAANEAYEKVREAIPTKTQAPANNTLGMIRERADELGGEQFLGPKEKMLLKVLDEKAKPTYARLDQYRKQIGQAIGKRSGPFKDADEGALKKLYGTLAQDQQMVAEVMESGDLYRTATNLVANRKAIEEQLTKTLGRDLTGAITAKARPAILGLQAGNTKQFDDLLANIPKELGADVRRSIVVTSLNDAFVQGARAERSMSVPGFDDFMKGIARHKGAAKRLENEIGPEAMRRLKTLHTVVSGVRTAQKSAITTGLISAVPRMFDEADNIASRVYGMAKALAKAEGVTTAAGAPGLGTAGVLGAVVTAKRGARSVAADEFLASAKFQDIIKKKAAGRLDTEAKIRSAEKAIERLKEYKKWKETLPERDMRDLTIVGAMGYLTGEIIEPIEE